MTSRIHAGRPTWRPILAIIAAAVMVAGAWAGFRHDAWAGTIAAALLVLALAGWFFAYHRYVWAERFEEQYRVLFNNSNDGVLVFGLGDDGVPTNFIQVNDVACQRLGYTREELLERSMRDFLAPGTLDFAPILRRLLAGDQWLFEIEALTRDGRGIPTEINARAFLLGGQWTVLAVARDITERKRAERYQNLSAEILGALNEPLGVRDAVGRILAAIKRETGFDAVGIRLRSGDDFPYFVQDGFSPDFLAAENSLIGRDENGNISLECACGLVLSGKTDPANPLFGEDGSFWTNNSLPLLDLTADQDPRLHPRNNCIHQGYRSVALIPIRVNRDIVGLLQLNDRKQDRFTLEQIHFFEGISASIGVALVRKQQEDALLESEARHRLLFDGSRDAMMTMAAPSWKFASGNPAALEMFGARDEAGFITLGPWDVSPERQPDGRSSADKIQEAMETALREGSLFFEWTHRRPDGTDFPATVLITRMEMAGQAFLEATVRDITAQKQAGERIEKTLTRQRGVGRLRQSLLAPGPLEDQLRKVTDAIVRLFDADFSRIWLIRPGDLCERGCIHAEVHEGPHVCRRRDRCLHLVTSSGRYTHIDGPGHRRVPFGCYKIGRVASGEDPKFVCNDVRNDPSIHNQAWARELGLESFAGYQLRTPLGETLGVLALFAKHPIQADEDAMLDGLGNTVARVVSQAGVEEALRAKEYTLSESQRIAHVGSWSWELPMGATACAWTPETYRVFGVSPDTFVPSAEGFLNLIHADDRASMQAWIDACLAGEEPPDLEFRVGLPDGGVRHILGRGHLERGAENQPIRVTGIAQDITERKQAEAGLRKSEALHRLLFDSSRDAMMTLAPPWWKFTSGNAAALAMFGAKGAAEFSALGPWDVSPERQPDGSLSADKAREAIEAAMREGFRSFEWMHRRLDGAEFLATVVLTRIEMAGQAFLEATVRDITESRRLAEDLARHAEKLARSNAELERFAYVASHDLQEPLRMVASFTQLLSKKYSGKLDETADRYIEFAVDGAKRMQQLIVDLLAFSRVNSKELDLRQTNCEAVVQTALQNLSAAMEESGAAIERDPLPVLTADAGQLGQLFQNLIGNAIKFRGQAPLRIHIAAADRGPDWLFSIQDNGIGIDPRYSDRIFQIFQRLHTRAEYPGTGIGLAVCQKVVERHGGKIWVESEPGAGSTFRFTIPKPGKSE